MNDCLHQWKMTNVQFGFTVFERCSHCQAVRTYFSPKDTWDEYREGGCTWSIVENAQTLRFDLQCETCKKLVSFEDLLGLMYCTSCMEDCPVECTRKAMEAQKTWILVAFGYLPISTDKPFSQEKLDILTDYFNQRRDTSLSKIKIIPFNLIKKFSMCRGEFIHDVGMLSPEPVVERKQLL
jgi:hypothetical protein